MCVYPNTLFVNYACMCGANQSTSRRLGHTVCTTPLQKLHSIYRAPMKIATIVYIFRLDVRQWNGRMGMGCDAEPMGWSVQRGHSIAIGGGMEH